MNESEHLLVCLAEECAEIQQAVTKALRFGLRDGYPESGRTNAQDIRKEMVDLIAVWELLEEKQIIYHMQNNEQAIKRKKARAIQYMNYAKSTGAMVEDNKG